MIAREFLFFAINVRDYEFYNGYYYTTQLTGERRVIDWFYAGYDILVSLIPILNLGIRANKALGFSAKRSI